MLARSPRLYGHDRSRWTLELVGVSMPWLATCSAAGRCRLLQRLGQRYKRGRLSVHSPDLLYNRKVACLRQARLQVQAEPKRYAFVYLDEHLIGRYPTLARCYTPGGKGSKPARQYAGYNSMFRMLGALDAQTGALLTQRCYSADIPTFLRFLHQVEEQYPQVERLYVALDNWSVHVSAQVLESLQMRQSKIVLLFLPTYAPWLNPIEKVWLKFKREVGHMHDYFETTKPWRELVDAWFEKVRQNAEVLVQETGLHTLSSLQLPRPEAEVLCKIHV